MKKINGVLLSAILFLSIMPTFSQNVLKVNAEGGEDYTTISAAIAAAEDGDIIQVYGVITGDGIPVQGILIDKNITIQGQGTDDTYIQGSLIEADESINQRVFTIAKGVTVTLRDMTIRHGFLNGNIKSEAGAAIKNMGNLVLRNCSVKRNMVLRSDCLSEGGIYNAGNAMLAVDETDPAQDVVSGF